MDQVKTETTPSTTTTSPTGAAAAAVVDPNKISSNAGSGFLWTLKKLATHAHFISIVAVIFIICFTKTISLWPHPIMIMITTLLAAILIPPVGLMDPKQFNKNSKTLDDDAATAGDADDVKGELSSNDKKKKQKHIKKASKTSSQKKKSQ